MSTLKEKIADLGDIASSSKFAEEFMKAQQNLREKFPTPESFLKLMKKMKDMTPEDRENFKESIGKNFKEFTRNLAGGKTPRSSASYSQYALFIGMVLLVIVVIGERCLLRLSRWLSLSDQRYLYALAILRIDCASAEFANGLIDRLYQRARSL